MNMYSLLVFMIVVLGFIWPTTAIQCPTASLEEAKKPQHQLAELAIHFYKNVSASQKDKNVVLSPASIALALAMLESGADGATRQEIKNHLVGGGSNTVDVLNSYRSLQQQLKIDDGSTKLAVANGIFPHKAFNLKPEFLSAVKDCYEAIAETKDFQGQLEETRKDINKWISDKTSQKIPELFKEGVLTADVKLVLANAIYFKGQWKSAFNPVDTKPSTFYKLGREQQTVPFMTKKGGAGYFEDGSLQVVQLDYKHEAVSMFVLVPKTRDGLSNLENGLTGEKFKSVTDNAHFANVILNMPKFSIRSPIDLKEIFPKMGMGKMFDESQADFSRMTGNRELKVSQAKHEAFINVHENGTEAAAATGFAMTPRSGPVMINADHPFMYAIVHKPTGAILFIGKVNYVENEN